MAKRPTLTDLTSLTNSSGVNAINSNWDSIQAAFDNTLSLDGSTPNAMNADLDLNGNALLNVGTIDADNLTLDGQTITDVSAVPEWRGSWLTGTSYVKRDMVKINGNVYICLVAHTSGTFSTDLTNLNWELMVSKGDSGEGTGDLVSTNNLSDLDNVATARSNLGLGTMATLASGTSDTQFRTNLQNDGRFQPLDADLTTIAGLSDPNADRILFWDDSASVYAYLTPGTGLSISGTTLNSTVSDLYYRLNSASVGSNGTSAQGVFPQSVTLEESSVYEYTLFYSLSRTAGATGHDIATLFGGTATLNNIYRDILVQGINTSATTAASISYLGYRLSAGAVTVVVGLSGATSNVWVTERGTVSISGAGTFIPQYQLSAAPGGAYSTNTGSFFKLRKLGSAGSDIAVGSWS